MKKAIVIGRHAPVLPAEFEVAELKNIMWPATSAECIPMIEELLQQVHEQDAVLLFQATPGQVTAGLCKITAKAPITHVPVGVIVSKPGERPAGKKRTFELENLAEIVAFVNPNAKVDGFEITVDSPMRFEFSHIEWI